jgi:hypothetical protein
MIVSSIYSTCNRYIKFKVVCQLNPDRQLNVGVYIDGLLVDVKRIKNKYPRLAVHTAELQESNFYSADSFVFFKDEDENRVIENSFVKLVDLIEFPALSDTGSNNVQLDLSSSSIKQMIRG